MTKKRWTKIIPLILFLVIVAALIILPMSVKNKSEKDPYEYVSAQSELREINSSLSGGGTVCTQEKTDVTVPDGVEITEFLVNNGEDVTAGQPVAEVDTLTVLAAIARVRESMVILEKNITELVNSGGDASIKSVADGRVKAIYAKPGDDVRSVLIEHGSLGIVSMDGLMCVEVNCFTDLLTGDHVTVKCADGKEYPGRVSSSVNGILTVTVTDDGPEIDEIAEVYDADSNLLGSGALKVNSPWKVVYADGTVSSVNMKLDKKVGKNTILVRLKDTGMTEKENYSRKHREYEDLLQELLTMFQSGQITAPCDGYVTGVDKSIATGLSADTEHKITLLAYCADPEGTEPPVTKVYNAVLVTTIIGSAYKGKVIPIPSLFVPDLENPDPDFSLIINYVSTIEKSVPESTLNLAGSPGAETIKVGDLFLLVTDPTTPNYESEILRIGYIEQNPSTIEIPDIDISGFGGFGGFAASDEEDPDLFPLDGSVVFSVTPKEEISITISVDELDILRYSTGMPADITIDALPGESFTGTVTKIAAVGTNSGGSSKFDVTVTLPYSENFLPGMNATVVIHTGSTGEVVTSPAAALQDRGSKSIVFTGYDEKNKVLTDPVTVEIGASDGEFVEIISGLTEGQTIWYTSYTAGN